MRFLLAASVFWLCLMNIFQLLNRKPPVALSCLYVILCLSRGLWQETGRSLTVTPSHCRLCSHWVTRCSHNVPAAVWFPHGTAFCFSSFHTKQTITIKRFFVLSCNGMVSSKFPLPRFLHLKKRRHALPSLLPLSLANLEKSPSVCLNAGWIKQ